MESLKWLDMIFRGGKNEKKMCMFIKARRFRVTFKK